VGGRGTEGEGGKRERDGGLLRMRIVSRNVTLHGIFEYQQGGEEKDLLFNMSLH